MSKRLKSGLITLGSIIIAVVSTPAWADFVQFANTKLLGWGIPAVVTTLLAVLINEIWRYLINQSILKGEDTKMGIKSASRGIRTDLY